MRELSGNRFGRRKQFRLEQVQQGEESVILAPVGRAGEKEPRPDHVFLDQFVHQAIPQGGSALLVRIEMMGLVDNEQVPRFGGEKALVSAPVVIPQGLQGSDHLVVGVPEIRFWRVRLGKIPAQADVEHVAQAKLPLFDEGCGTNDQQPFDQALGQQRPKNETGLDGLAEPHVIGNQKLGGPVAQHPVADPELMRQQGNA